MHIARCVILLAVPGAALAGDLTDRMQLTIHRILQGGPPRYSEDLILADAVPRHTRRFTEFSGDVSGRYIEAMSVAAATQAGARLDSLVTALVPLQKPDGHFGDALDSSQATDATMAILWGNGRLLIGLMEYHRLHPRPEVLAAARRIGDFLIDLAPLYNSAAVREKYNGEKYAVGYICWTQQIEGLVALYRATREQRYLDLARAMAARTDRHPAQHSHGFLTSLRGVLELYRETGEKQYLEQVEKEWRSLLNSGNVMLQGGVPEMFAPRQKRDEGCSEADWLRLSLALWRETGDAAYLEQAERTWFNEFAYNQFHTGDFGHHTMTAAGMAEAYTHGWWCCTLFGLRAMADVERGAFRIAADGSIEYGLPVDGSIETKDLAVRAVSSLERDGTVRLEVLRAGNRPQTLAVRTPAWSAALPAPVTKVWKKGETIILRYKMQINVLRDPKRPRQIVIFCGPWLLAVDRQASPAFFDEPHEKNQVMVPAAGELNPATAAPGPFTVPVANYLLRYLPGGYPMQPATAVLRPIAEHTMSDDANPVEWWLPERAAN
jgi:DUF1680 family protein